MKKAFIIVCLFLETQTWAQTHTEADELDKKYTPVASSPFNSKGKAGFNKYGLIHTAIFSFSQPCFSGKRFFPQAGLKIAPNAYLCAGIGKSFGSDAFLKEARKAFDSDDFNSVNPGLTVYDLTQRRLQDQ